MAAIRCPHCGATNRAGSNFCNACGADLRGEDAPPSLDERVGQPAISPPSPAEPTEPPAPKEASAQEAEPASGEEPARPLFDLGLASPGAEDPWLADQPWLQPETDEAAWEEGDELPEDVFPGEEEESFAPIPEGRLITGVQGLLAPLNITSRVDQQTLVSPSLPPTAGELSLDEARRIRRLLAEEPSPVPSQEWRPPRRWPTLRIPWIFWVIGLSAFLPIALLLSDPAGEPRQWPGVEEAYATIDRLPSGATVLVYWAYDPATGGELDQVAEPVVRHLLDKRVHLAVVSTLPGGPATARRLVARAASPADNARNAGLPDSATFFRADARMVANVFLAGGVAALPLVGQDLPAALGVDAAGLDQPPALTLVFAARGEDVQYWLEQVQPRNRAPVVAIASAVVDPQVRPYWDSGQLSGLVSGFDGAYSYERLRTPFRIATPQGERVRLTAQNWGQIALLVIIGLGNLAAILGFRREE
jgi:hypothetical protein